MITRPLQSRSLSVLLLIAALALSGASAYGACPGTTTWSGAVSNSWDNALNWVGGIPTASSDACISLATNNPVVMTGVNSTSTLTLGSASNSVNIGDNSNLTVSGSTISLNGGAMGMNSAGNPTDLIINGTTTTLSGGALTLSNQGNNRIYSTNGSTFVNAAGNTIQGSGQFGIGGNATFAITLNNAGTINADQSVSLTIFTGSATGATNTGTLEATNNGTLVLNDKFANAGGLIQATGANATVNFGGSTITGGTLTTTGGGLLQNQSGTAATLNGVTISSGSTLTVHDASSTTLQGTITNNGTIAQNSAGNTTDLIIKGAVNLSGAGSVVMTNQGNNRWFGASASGNSLVIGANQVISGAGQIGINNPSFALSVTNNGIINANQTTALTINTGGGGVTNNNLLEATGGGTLVLQDTFANATGTIQATAGSTVNLGGSTINGGTLTTTGTGLLQDQSGNAATLNGVTLSSGSTLTLHDASATTLQGTITNNGTIAQNSAGNTTDLIIKGAVNLNGTGSIVLTNQGNNRIYGVNASGNSLVIGANQVISGAGQIGINNSSFALAVTNNGLIDATQSGALTIATGSAGGVTNNTTLEATAGGHLAVADTINNAGGAVILSTGAGALVTLGGSTINGGTLTTANGGVMANNGVATLNNVTISGGSTLTLNDNTTTTLTGTITNNGTIAQNSAGNLTDLRVSGAVTLTGSGTVNMSNQSNNRIYGFGSDTLVNDVSSTIQGSGKIGVGVGGNAFTLTNKGTIDANLSAGLTINTGGATGVANMGTLEATSGGTLNIIDTINNTGAGFIMASAGSTVNLGGSTINGGTLTTTGGGVIQNNSGSANINNVTISSGSQLTLRDNTTTTLTGTILNNGTIAQNSAGNDTDLRVSGAVTLTGSGSLVLSSQFNNRLYGTGGSASLLNDTNHTIQGAGQIGVGAGGNAFALTNKGLIDANVGSTMLIATGNPLVGVTNTGTMRASSGGTLNIADIVTNGGGLILSTGAGSTVNLAGSTINGGTLTTTLGGTMNNGAGNNTLNGVTITGGSLVKLNDNTTTTLMGTITNNGTIFQDSAGNFTDVHVSGTVTLNGTGSYTMSNQGNNRVFSLTGTDTLVNGANHTIQGSGQLGIGIGGDAFTLTNNGTIIANQSVTLNVNPGVVLNNPGLLQASNGGTMVATGLTTTLANGGFNSGTLTGNYLVDGTAGAAKLQINSFVGTGGEVTTLGNGNLPSSIFLNGTNANTKFVDSTGNNALNLGTVTANASLTVNGGYLMTTSAGLSNAGNVTVGTGSSLTTAGFYFQSAGTTLINGTLSTGGTEFAESGGVATVNGTLNATSFSLTGGTTTVNAGGVVNSATGVSVAGGTLQGIGTVTSTSSTVSSNGTLLPGFSGNPGTFTFTGPLLIVGGGTLSEGINGAAAGQFGVTNVSGQLNVNTGAVLSIAESTGVQNGSTAIGVGQTLTIMTSGGLTGPGFASVGGQNTFDNGLEKWTVANVGNNIVLQATAVNPITATWSTGSGNWTTNSGSPNFNTNWACNVPVLGGCVPNNNAPLAGTQYNAVLNSAGHIMTLSGASDIPGNITVNSVNLQNGTLQVTAGATLTATGATTNSDTLQIDTGSKLTTGTLTNYSGGTLTGGTYNLNGTGVIQSAAFNGTGIQTVASGTNITLSGANGSASGFQNTSNGDALAALQSNSGNLTVTGGRTFNDTAAAGLTNNGTVTVGASSNVTASGAGGYTQAAGTTTINGSLTASVGNYSQTGGTTSLGAGASLFASSGNVNVSGGTLQVGNNGAVTTGTLNVNTGGTLLPGANTSTPGSMTVFQTAGVGGNLNINGGTLDEVLNGTTAGTFSFINAQGTITLGGTLDILGTLNAANPGIGTSITIMTGGSPATGAFATIQNDVFNGNTEKWNVVISGDNVNLVAASNNEITATWTGTGPGAPNGNWTTNVGGVTDWACAPVVPNCVPNNGGSGNYAAVLNSTGNTMTLSAGDTPKNITVDSVNIQHGTLSVTGAGTTLTVTGGLTNSDTLSLGTGAAVTPGSITNFGGGTLTGGTWNMNGGTLAVGAQITTIGAGTTVQLTSGGSTSGFLNGASDALGTLATNNGTLRVFGGTTFTTSAGTLTNSSTGNLLVGAVSTINANNYTNHGLTQVNGGKLNVINVTDTGTTHVLASGTLTATGTYTESGTMTIDNGGTVSAATYNNTGSTTVSGMLSAQNYNDNSGGTTTIDSGGLLSATGTYTENGGFTDIASGGKLTAVAVTLTAGKMQVDGTLDPLSIDVLPFFELDGTGTITANVTNDGEVFLGDDPTAGKLSINGNYTQNGDGALVEDILISGDGLLAINGSLNAGGTVDVNSLNFTPTFDELFKFVTYTGSLNGTFSGVTGMDASDWALVYTNPGEVDLEWTAGGCTGPSCTATPEPKFVLLDLGLLALAAGLSLTRKKQTSL